MVTRQSSKIWLGLLLTMLLTACGGGGAGSSGTADGVALAEGINLIVVESERDGASALEVAIDEAERIKVTVKLLDATKLPVAREVVTAAVDIGAISSPPSLTDSNGLTTFYIEAPSPLATETVVGTLTVGATGYADRTVRFEFKQTVTAPTVNDPTVTEPTVTEPTADANIESKGVFISFISADPTYIGLKGVGGLGLSQQSNVTFSIKDIDGNPVNNRLVNFKLATEIGGLSLSATEAYTNPNGEVSTRVLSGTVPTSVRVMAYFSVGG